MSVTVADLQPKPFKVSIKVKGTDEKVEVDCSPLRLSHALQVSKIGNIFNDSANTTPQQLKQAEEDMDVVIAELMPELKGIKLDIGAIMEVIEQLMASVQPSDNKELREKGVNLEGSDPKTSKTG